MFYTAAVLINLGSKIDIIDSISHGAIQSGQLLIKMLYAGMCHSQLMEARGLRGEDKYLPHMLGHEGVGIVEQVGEGVTKVKVGDKVVLGWIKGDGLEAGGTVYDSPIGKINAGAVTTFSDYSVVSENRVVKVPKHFDDKLAVLLGCALPTGAGIVLNQVKPEPNSTVVVYGLGGIGLSALLALRHFESIKIIAVDIEDDKLTLAKEFGAAECYKADEIGIKQLRENHANDIDYAIEAAGTVESIEAAFSLVRRGGGQCVFASHPKHGDKISIDPFELICGKQIAGSWGGGSQPDKDIPVIADIITKYNLPVHKLLSKEYSLDEINDALDDLEQRKIVRALIKL
ncbi:alcohol dehydrogenase catalytic domain-containing protein [Algibacillus agarilyticus]|uniref:alcohol dehydrogenase catalytic domain-containing protein n=1 Tax=Algibacillus agarilyticus TaxID=2234133 RepID=UPI000DD0EA57|nr:zinc-binding dehydrogenase [Algibacillus agarilyticus]